MIVEKGVFELPRLGNPKAIKNWGQLWDSFGLFGVIFGFFG